MLITDGRQHLISSPTEPRPEQVSAAMKARGIEVMVMAVGLADPIELSKLISDWNYIRKMGDLSHLDDSVLDQAYLLCPRKLQHS